MRKPILWAALLAGLAGLAPAALADQGRHHAFDDRVTVVVVVPPPWHPGNDRWRFAPWRYQGYGDCLPAYCLPWWDRGAGAFARVLPLDRVLERLALLDYHSFGLVFFDGPHYSIEARSRYGRAVRLIVDAGTGQIQRILE